MDAAGTHPIAVAVAPAAPVGRIPRRVLVASALLASWIAVLSLLHLGGHNAAPLLRDPATMAGLPVWHGAMSTLGCMAWAVVAALCLCVHVAREDPGLRTWALLAALAAALGVDDALMLHEEVLPSIGVAQEFTFLAYGVVAALIARDIIARPGRFDAPLLLVACGALGLSIGLDVLVEDGAVIYEDGPKAFGVAVLVVWAAGRASTHLRRGDDAGGRSASAAVVTSP